MWASMQDEVARWDDLVIGLRPAPCRAKGKSVRRLVSVDPARLAKASSEGWRLRLRPNTAIAAKSIKDLPTLTTPLLPLPLSGKVVLH
jgi:hypothetical protein